MKYGGNSLNNLYVYHKKLNENDKFSNFIEA